MYYNKLHGREREGQEISLINIDMLEVLFSVWSWTDKMLTPNQLRSVNIFVWIGTRIAIELGMAGLGVWICGLGFGFELVYCHADSDMTFLQVLYTY